MQFNFGVMYITGLILCVIGIKVKNLRMVISVAASVVVFLLMSSVVTGGTIYSDLTNYDMTYRNVSSGMVIHTDKFYYLLMKLGVRMHLSFPEFKTLLMAVLLFLMIKTIKRYTSMVVFFLPFYMMDQMLLDTMILRNFIGYVIVLYVLHYLMEDKKFSLIKFTIGVLLAAQFHSAMHVYLLLLLTKVDFALLKKLKKLFPFLIITVIIMLRQSTLLLGIMKLVGKILQNDKYERYAVQKTRYGWLPVLVIWSLTVLSCLYVNYHIQKKKEPMFLKEIRYRNRAISVKPREIEVKKISTIVSRINLIGCLLMPMTILILHFARINRNLSVLNIIYMAMSYEYMGTDKKMKRRIIFLTFMITLGWFLFDNYVYGSLTWEHMNDWFLNGRWFWDQK